MGIGFLFWSWLALAGPMQQGNGNSSNQAKVATQKHVTGVASFYHPKFVGCSTATGEEFSNEKFTAASNHFKLGTYVKVTNQKNGKSIVVKINDRMGQPNRVIDLTNRAARALSFVGRGITKVLVEEISSHEGRAAIMAQRQDSIAVNPDNVY